MKRINIGFTGHRPNGLDGSYEWRTTAKINIAKVFIKIINILQYNFNIDQVNTGGAIGFDQIIYAVLEKNFPKIKRVVHVPFKDQPIKWKSEDVERYYKQLYNAYLIHYTDINNNIQPFGKYSSHKMNIRNESIVDHSNLIMACWKYILGGTANAIHYAEKNNKPIIIVHPESLKVEFRYKDNKISSTINEFENNILKTLNEVV